MDNKKMFKGRKKIVHFDPEEEIENHDNLLIIKQYSQPMPQVSIRIFE